ncbi:MAG: hypothetical protein K0R94_621 [Burkholderiales bacterium]|jgi:uncharacterized membrane protein YecN with MAPEG domain|nr:hypothetical protein [Burkholderiales bacterium]
MMLFLLLSQLLVMETLEAEVTYQMLGFEKAKEQVEKFGGINNKIPVIIISFSDMENKAKPIKEAWLTGLITKNND